MPTPAEIEQYLRDSRKKWDEEQELKRLEEIEKKRLKVEQSKNDKQLQREIRDKKNGRLIPATTYCEEYEMLDSFIEDIEEMIATGKFFQDIAETYNIRYTTLRNWLRESREYARIRLAFEYSAEWHVEAGRKLIRSAIEDPDLTMQQAALYRAELYNHNAIAAFRQPKVFGKKAEEGLASATVVIATDNQIQTFIDQVKENKRIEAEQEVEFEEADEIDSDNLDNSGNNNNNDSDSSSNSGNDYLNE